MPFYRTTQQLQQPLLLPVSGWNRSMPPACPPGPVVPGRPICCSLLYLRISRTRLLKASSTFMRCFAEVSMNRHPKCFASSRPSVQRLPSAKQDKVPPALPSRTSALTMTSYLSLIFQIALVCHDDNGKVVFVFDPQDLLMKSENLVEAVSRGDAIHQQKSLSSSHVLLPHCSGKGESLRRP